jgi:hypothetical protein
MTEIKNGIEEFGDEIPNKFKLEKSRIMYIEDKSSGPEGDAWI